MGLSVTQPSPRWQPHLASRTVYRQYILCPQENEARRKRNDRDSRDIVYFELGLPRGKPPKQQNELNGRVS